MYIRWTLAVWSAMLEGHVGVGLDADENIKMLKTNPEKSSTSHAILCNIEKHVNKSFETNN